MDKLTSKSSENTISIEKSNLSDSSTNTPENGVSVPVLAIKTEENEKKPDISSNFIAEPFPDSVSVISIPLTSQSPDEHPAESKIVLIGTAHVSEKSVEEVKAVIRSLKPDVVAVELCKGRFDSLGGNTQEEQIFIKDLLSGGKIYYYTVHWLLAHLQKKIGDNMKVKPGAEMLSAMEEAKTVSANIALIDRDIQVTLQRFWGKMKFLEKVKMIGSLLGSLIDLGKGDDADLDINQITEPDFVAELISELRGFAPTAAKVLIDERDAYLAGSIIEAAEGGNKTVVVVIGAGHKSGVSKYLKNPKTIPTLETLTEIPKKKYRITKIISFIFVGLIIAFFLLLLLSGISLKLFLISFVIWFLITGVLSALGTLLAGGHRTSILTSFYTAWITTPHAGWFAGLVEAKKRNPKASDIKALFTIENFSDIFKNNIMRVLLVASFANIGSVIGAVLGVQVIMQVTGVDPREIFFAGLRALGL